MTESGLKRRPFRVKIVLGLNFLYGAVLGLSIVSVSIFAAYYTFFNPQEGLTVQDFLPFTGAAIYLLGRALIYLTISYLLFKGDPRGAILQSAALALCCFYYPLHELTSPERQWLTELIYGLTIYDLPICLTLGIALTYARSPSGALGFPVEPGPENQRRILLTAFALWAYFSLGQFILPKADEKPIPIPLTQEEKSIVTVPSPSASPTLAPTPRAKTVSIVDQRPAYEWSSFDDFKPGQIIPVERLNLLGKGSRPGLPLPIDSREIPNTGTSVSQFRGKPWPKSFIACKGITKGIPLRLGDIELSKEDCQRKHGDTVP